ncbi:GNAT family N-acetyltransferase [Microbacterium saperdae]
MITIDTLSGAEAAEHRDEVLRIWSASFGPVEDPGDWTASPWDRHRARPGYRLVLAREDGESIGFAWGYTGERGQYWSDAIVREVGPRVEGWVGGHFEFVELAVLPAARGRGVAGQLHDALLARLPHERALLATSDAPEDPAVRLYRSRGWLRLAGHGENRQIMGLVLPR